MFTAVQNLNESIALIIELGIADHWELHSSV